MGTKTLDRIKPGQELLPSKDEDVTIRVGLGVTQVYGYGGVRYAGTIVEVLRNGREVVVRNDDAVVKPGQEGTWFGGNIEYDYYSNPDAHVNSYTLRKDGTYRAKGADSHWASRLSLGVRRQYEDPSL